MVRAGMTVVTIPDRLGSRRMTPSSLSRDPLGMLAGRLFVLDAGAAFDPRLAGVGDAVGPPIDRARWARLRNAAVFDALGLALASDRDVATIAGILDRLVPGGYEDNDVAREFANGTRHGRMLKDVPRRTRALPHAGIDAALARAQLPLLSSATARRLHLALNPHRDPIALLGTARWRLERALRRILAARA
jgi:hypothetical protein